MKFKRGPQYFNSEQFNHIFSNINTTPTRYNNWYAAPKTIMDVLPEGPTIPNTSELSEQNSITNLLKPKYVGGQYIDSSKYKYKTQMDTSGK